MADQQSPEKSIFLSALEIGSAAERAAFLEQACAGNPALRAAVEALLQAHERPQQLLDAPLVEAPTVDQAPELERLGTVVGPYKLVEVIGEGGMGTVYMAQQTEPVRRLVAVKLIKPGMDTRQVLARFGAERQALALMEHPNVARVLDAGATASGRPYFVMELVKGVPITRYCDEHRLAPRERLELFIPVCQAIQHAHQKGIIHRDIKPSNVLVASFDGKPVPKVIDFGLAKATGQQLTERTLVTGFGAVVGTLEYMSPEQAELNQIDIDTRSDIYSLGVLLYELLTGSTPLEKKRLKEAAMLEVLRLIREEEPPRPSTRLSDSNDSLPSISAQRQMEPAKLTRLVRGELDWIAMKALEKDRNRRYETANGLALDVQRYLADETVQACPPSVGYRLKKWVRRHRPSVSGTAAALFVALLLVGCVSWWLWQQATTRRAVHADLEAAEAGLREDRDPAQTGLALERARARLSGGGSSVLQDRLKWLERDVATVNRLEQSRLQHSLPSLKDPQGVDYTGASRQYGMAFTEYGLDVDVADRETTAARVRASAIRTQLILALDDWAFCRDKLSKGSGTTPRLIAERADDDPLRQRLREAVARQDKAALLRLAEEADVLEQPPAHLWLLASALRDADEIAAAERLLRPALERHPGDFWINFLLARIQELKKPPDRGEAVRFYQAALAVRPQSAAVLENLGNDLRLQKRLAEAEAVCRKAIQGQPENARPYVALGRVLSDQKKPTDAETAYRKAIQLQPDHAAAYNGLGNVLAEQKRPADAEAAYRKAIQLQPDFAVAYNGLGNHLAKQNKAVEAEAAFRKAIELQPNLASAYIGLGNVLADQKRPADAEAAYRKAIEFDPDFALAYSNLGTNLYKQNKAVEAETTFRKAIQLQPDLAAAYHGLGTVLRDQKRVADAEAAFRKAIELQPEDAKSYNNLGIVLSEQKKFAEAETAFRKAIELQPDFAYAYNGLGNILSDGKKPAEAETAYRKAIELQPNYGNAYNGLGNVLRDQQKLVEAEAAYRKVIELEPKSGLAFYNLGVLLSGENKLVEAEAAYRKAIELQPEQYIYYSNLGGLLLRQKKLAEGEEAFRNAIQVRPEYATAHYGLGISLVAQNKLAEGEEAYRKAIELQPDLPGAYVNFGKLLSRQNRLVEAEAVFQRAVRIEPKNADAYNSLGNVLRDRKKLAEAAAAYRKAIEIDPKYLPAINFLVRTLNDTGELDEVCVVLDEALRRMPGDAELRRTRAEYYVTQKKWREAADDLSELIRQVPADANFRRTRADCSIKLKKWREAAADFAEVSRLNPDDFNPPYHGAVALLAAGDGDGYRRTCAAMFDRFGKVETPAAASHTILTCMLAPEAVADFGPLVRLQEQVVARDPGSWYFLVEFGGILCRAGRYEESAGALKKSCAAHPNGGNGYDWYFLALAHHHLGHADEARQWLTKAVVWHARATWQQIGNSLTPTPLGWNDQVIMAQLCREAAALILGSEAEAIDALSELIRQAPAVASLRQTRAESYIAQKKWREAEDDLSELIRQVPTDANFRRTRAECHVAQKKWREAAADFDVVCQLQPDDVAAWDKCAMACLGARDHDGFRRACNGMLKACGKLPSPNARNWVSWTAFHAPDATSDFGPFLKLQEEVLKQRTDAKDPILWFYQMTYGAILCRAGQHEKSVQQLTASCQLHSQGGNGFDWFFLALAHHHLGHPEEARRWLDKAVAWIEPAALGKIKDPFVSTPLTWMERLTMRLLRREAEALILGKIEIQSPCPPERE